MICASCKKEIPVLDRVGRCEVCPHCRSDLHTCTNCGHYDLSAYNECREPQADRVLEKDRSNFCDYFTPARKVASGNATLDPAAEAKKKLEALFKKP